MNDPNALVLSATYGLLVTADRGKNWHLVCERSLFGRLPSLLDELDPLLELTPGGAIISGSNHALRVSHDSGCTFGTATALPVDPTWLEPPSGTLNDKGAVVDISLERAKGDKAAVALAVLADFKGAPAAHQIYESIDDGVTWIELGKPIPPSMARETVTVDVAPSDARRIYVTGRGTMPRWSLIASQDGGETWAASEIPGSEETYGAYIAAVSATDPNVIYVRTDRWLPDSTGGDLGEDTLLLTTDGGKTWNEIFRKSAKLMGFALSPDGKTVLVGLGDPVMPDGRHVEEADMGLYRADTGTASFTKILDASITCLTWNKTGVYACASQDRDGFHLGFAPSPSFDLSQKNPLQPLLKLPDVRGPLPWAAGTSGGVCLGDWTGMPPTTSGICARLGACRDGGLSGSGPPLCGGGGAPDGGTGGSGPTGGAAGSGATAGAAGGGAGGASGSAASPAGTGGASGGDGTCGCRIPGAPARTATGAWELLLVAWVLRPRLRRRR